MFFSKEELNKMKPLLSDVAHIHIYSTILLEKARGRNSTKISLYFVSSETDELVIELVNTLEASGFEVYTNDNYGYTAPELYVSWEK